MVTSHQRILGNAPQTAFFTTRRKVWMQRVDSHVKHERRQKGTESREAQENSAESRGMYPCV